MYTYTFNTRIEISMSIYQYSFLRRYILLSLYCVIIWTAHVVVASEKSLTYASENVIEIRRNNNNNIITSRVVDTLVL